jgi:ADP-ribose pyrophosphatase
MATGITRGAARLEADEFVEVVPLPISKALAMVRDGEIVDAKTALTLLYVAGFRLGR